MESPERSITVGHSELQYKETRRSLSRSLLVMVMLLIPLCIILNMVPVYLLRLPAVNSECVRYRLFHAVEMLHASACEHITTSNAHTKKYRHFMLSEFYVDENIVTP